MKSKFTISFECNKQLKDDVTVLKCVSTQK
jgi:hypothetical protein